VNKVVLTHISALVVFLCKVVTSVHGYEQDKVSYKMIWYILMYACCTRKYNRINMVIGSTVDPQKSNGLILKQLETRTKNSRKIRFETQIKI
jgi:hypothetical protein